MRLVYFAWVRERIGRTDEEVEPPPEVATVADLVRWLKTRGEEYAYAFALLTLVMLMWDGLGARAAESPTREDVPA